MVVMVSIGQGVDMGIVDQGVVAISPGELLGPKKEKFRKENCFQIALT